MTEAPPSRSWRAIGTSVHVLVTAQPDLEPAARAVARVLDDVDLAYSRFRPDSELRRLDVRPGRPAVVSPLLGLAVGTALRAARLTGGAVDPTVGRAMRLAGYDLDFASLARVGGQLEVRLEPVPGWQAVRFDPRTRELSMAEGVELDLGSTGKALAADLAAEAALIAIDGERAAAAEPLTPDGGALPEPGVLVSLGGDIAMAGTAPEGGWRILAAEDSDTPPDAPGEVIALAHGAVATSSTTVRRWERGDVHLHHLLDPATGRPAESPWRTVSVVAVTCVDANAAATATIVKGAAGLDWLTAQRLPARLVGRDGGVVRIGGWPEPVASRA
ncbi:MAG TPA: FAD:protein FMN transferase [Candidatus Limnocylindrales bacterium]